MDAGHMNRALEAIPGDSRIAAVNVARSFTGGEMGKRERLFLFAAPIGRVLLVGLSIIALVMGVSCGARAGSSGSINVGPAPCSTPGGTGPRLSATTAATVRAPAGAIAEQPIGRGTSSATSASETRITATTGSGPYSMSPQAIKTAKAWAESFENAMPSRYPTTIVATPSSKSSGPGAYLSTTATSSSPCSR
jgi:hypothetical protein